MQRFYWNRLLSFHLVQFMLENFSCVFFLNFAPVTSLFLSSLMKDDEYLLLYLSIYFVFWWRKQICADYANFNKYWMRFCYDWDNQGLGKCYQPRPSARMITLISTLTFRDIRKQSNLINVSWKVWTLEPFHK